jgi:hypothetical protein
LDEWMQVQMKMKGIYMKKIFLFYIIYIYSDEEGERTHQGSSHKSVIKSVWKLFIVYLNI